MMSEAAKMPANKRVSLLKIKQMNKKQFVQFLKDISPNIKDGKIDSENMKITEKIDGSSYRIAWFNNEVWGETSHSGMVNQPSKFSAGFMVAFKETLKYTQKKFQKPFEAAFKNKNYKFVGELLYTKDIDIDEDETVTFIATKYNPKKLGNLATYVVFTVLEYNGTTKEFEPIRNKKDEKTIIKTFKKMQDSEFKILTPADISWNGNIDLEYTIGTDELKNILTTPEVLLTDAELLEKVREGFVKAFEKALNEKGSELGTDSSTIEGIVMDLGDSQIGFQNPEWYKLKNKLWNVVEEYDAANKEYFYNLIGKKTKASINKYLKENKNKLSAEFIKRYIEATEKLKKQYIEIAKTFNNNKESLPKNLQKNFTLSVKDNTEAINLLNVKDVNTIYKFLRIEGK